MPKRNYIEEILDKNRRLPGVGTRWEQVSGRMLRLRHVLTLLKSLEIGGDLIELIDQEKRVWELEDISSNHDIIRFEISRYVPIALVACMESFFRLVYADLINQGPPFIENLSKFDSIKLSLDLAVSLRQNSLSPGDFAAHLLPNNNLDDINSNMSILIGEDFLKIFKQTRALLDERQNFFYTPEEITDFAIRDIKRVFDLRHVFAHEADPHTNDGTVNPVQSGTESVLEFLWVSENIISNLLAAKA